MNQCLQDLHDTMVQENKLLQTLCQIGEDKKKLIILGKLEELEQITQREGLIASNLEKVEAERFKNQQKLAAIWEMPAEELVASTLIEKARQEISACAADLQKEVEQLNISIARLNDINSENNELINMSLDYIDEMQAVLVGQSAGTYSNAAEQVDESSSRPSIRLLDTKA